MDKLSFACSSSLTGKRRLESRDIEIFCEHGVKCLELTLRDGFSSISDRDELCMLERAVAEKLISIHSAHLYHDNAEGLSAAGNIARIGDTQKRLGRFGTQYLVLHPSDKNIAETEKKGCMLNCIRNMERLYRTVADTGVKLALEILPPEKLMSDYDAIDFILDRTDPAMAGLCVDVNHALGTLKPETVITKYAKRILGFHFSDNDGLTERHWPPFSGTIDWKMVMNAIGNIGYAGPLNFEYGYADNLSEAIRRRKELYDRLIKLLPTAPHQGGTR